jgi:small subunit ribosomal protein S24e
MVDKLKVIVTKKNRNDLLKRNEITFKIDHIGSGTPTRENVKKKLSVILDKDKEKIILLTMKTKTGTFNTIGTANIYDSIEQSKNIEPKHIIKRNISENVKKE